MLEDYVFNHTRISEGDILSHTPPKQRIHLLASYIPTPKEKHGEKHL